MAKSLLCKDCGLLLRNVADAQNHNEVTGHTNFEETTVAVSNTPGGWICREVLHVNTVPNMMSSFGLQIKVQKCTACGKPCRSDAERDMHKRFTGHTEYVEQVGIFCFGSM